MNGQEGDDRTPMCTRPQSKRALTFAFALFVSALTVRGSLSLLNGNAWSVQHVFFGSSSDFVPLEPPQPHVEGRDTRCEVDLRPPAGDLTPDQVPGLLPAPQPIVSNETMEELRRVAPGLFFGEWQKWGLTPTGNRCWGWKKATGKPTRCLPAFYLGGPTKGGTTDLWMRLRMLPNLSLSRDHGGETNYWSRRLYPELVLSKPRVNALKKRPHPARKSRQHRLWKLHRDMSCDMTIEEYGMLMYELGSIRQNKHPREWDTETLKIGGYASSYLYDIALAGTNLTTPDAMAAIVPNAKVMFTLRDPVSRLKSDYFFFNMKAYKHPEIFEQECGEKIDAVEACLREYDERTCFVSLERGYIYQHPCRLEVGVYAVFLEYWLRAFPRESLLFLKSECFFSNPERQLERVLDFIDVAKPSEKVWQDMVTTKTGNKNSHNPNAVSDEFLERLRSFYAPYEARLDDMLGPEWRDCN